MICRFFVSLLLVFQFSTSIAQEYLMLPEFRFILNPDSFRVSTSSSEFDPIPTTLRIFDKNRYFASNISISTGYVTGRSNWVYTSRENKMPISPQDPGNKIGASPYSTLTREILNVHGKNFKWFESYEEVCNSKGKEDLYNITVFFDSVYNHFSFIKIQLDANRIPGSQLIAYRNKIRQIIDELSRFERVDPHLVLHSAQTIDLRRIQRSFEKSLHKNERRCRRYLYLETFRDTSWQHDNYLSKCSYHEVDIPFIQYCKKNGHRWELADSITQIRKSERLDQWNSLKALISEKGYSLEDQYSVNKRFAQFETPYSDFLNALQTNRPHGNLDTIYYYMLLAPIDPDEYRESWKPKRYRKKASFSGWDYSADHHEPTDLNSLFSGKRIFQRTEEFLIRTIYHNEFGITSPYRLNYLQYDQENDAQAFILFENGLDTSGTEYLVYLSPTSSDQWLIDIDTLSNAIQFDGSEILVRFNEHYFMKNSDGTYLLNTSTSPSSWIQLNVHPETLSSFDFVSLNTTFGLDGNPVVPGDCYFSNEAEKLQLKIPLTIEDYLPSNRREENPEELIIGNSNRDSEKKMAIGLYETHLAREVIAQDKMAFRVDYTQEDINQDGIEELFSYVISNGKCVWIDCYTSVNHQLVRVPDDEALALLQKTYHFQNLAIYSKIGMHENSK